MEISVSDWLQAADHEVELRRWREQSGGKTKHFSVEHHFPHTSPEMVFWYLTNFDRESYLMWHPAHIGLQWEDKVAGPGAIHIAWEKVLGKLAAYRIRLDTPDVSPIPPKETSIAVMLNVIDTEGEILFYILNEIEQVAEGMKITCTFIFPEAAPEEFIEAHRQHNIEELQGLVNKAVPYLIQKTFGYMIEPGKLAAYGLIVPADAS
ncbi:MAG: hypothetical protein C4536_03240 [Actinobacteria bacterium]|jgi:hypothetical protein|nr:MAG: hypothetical protein C4536_03240 [Actinomycetota bacterium]